MKYTVHAIKQRPTQLLTLKTHWEVLQDHRKLFLFWCNWPQLHV